MSEQKEKFTPGPWYLNPEMDLMASEPCIYCGYKPDFFEPQESIVAEVGNKEGNIVATAREYSILEPTEEEVMANANLIAAAPEMYELLKIILNNLRHGIHKSSIGVVTEQRIEDLLAKARGEVAP